MVQHFIYLAVIFAMLTMVMYLAYDSYCASKDERCKTLSMTFLVLFAATAAVMLGIIAYNASGNGSSYARPAPARPYYANANANGNARMRE
jgi:cation transport ATPase